MLRLIWFVIGINKGGNFFFCDLNWTL